MAATATPMAIRAKSVDLADLVVAVVAAAAAVAAAEEAAVAAVPGPCGWRRYTRTDSTRLGWAEAAAAAAATSSRTSGDRRDVATTTTARTASQRRPLAEIVLLVIEIDPRGLSFVAKKKNK